MMRLILFIIVSLSVLTVSSEALVVYSLNAGDFETEEAAKVLQSELSSKMSPVFVEKSPDYSIKPWRVLVGHIPYEAEAWVFKSRLKEVEIPGCEVVSWNWDGRTLEENTLPIELPFEPDIISTLPRDAECRLYYEDRGEPSQDEQAALDAVSMEGLNEEQLYYRGDWGDTDLVAIPSLEYLLEEYPFSDIAHKARLRLSRRYMARQKYEEAQKLLDEVSTHGTAEEKSKAKLLSAYLFLYKTDSKTDQYNAFIEAANYSEMIPEDRLEAMLRAAALAHKLYRFTTAWLAYSQIEKAVDTPKIVTFAKMQKSALAFELVGRDVGQWEETRKLCEIAESVDNAPDNVAATARLMWAETFFKQKEYQKALEEMERLRQDYPNVERECATALYWIGRCQYFLGQYDQAIETFSALENEPVEVTKLFAALNVKSRGLLEKARLMMRQNQTEEAKAVLAELVEKYPDSNEAKDLVVK
jgi:TolA-binding protein